MNDNKVYNYYETLCINKDATTEEIKKAYKKKALQYHPDRNAGNKESEEIFKDISVAYQVLSDKDKKNKYDLYGTVDEEYLDRNTMNIFTEIFKSQVNSLFGDEINISDDFLSPEIGGIKFSVHTFKNNNFDNDITDTLKSTLKNLNNNIGNIFTNNSEKKPKINKLRNRENTKRVIYLKTPPDLIYNITAKLEDIYILKKKMLKIERYRKINKKPENEVRKIKVPLYGKTIRLSGEGNELEGYVEHGDLVINIIDEKHNRFRRINEGDLITSYKIKLEDIYKGIIFEFNHLNGKKINIECKKESLLNQDHFIQKVKKLGLPYYNEEKEKIVRGNLYIRYIIELPNICPLNISEKNNEDKEVEDIEEKYISKNCSYSDVYQNIDN